MLQSPCPALTGDSRWLHASYFELFDECHEAHSSKMWYLHYRWSQIMFCPIMTWVSSSRKPRGLLCQRRVRVQRLASVKRIVGSAMTNRTSRITPESGLPHSAY